MNNSCRGDYDIYTFMRANDSVEKVLPVIEEFYDLSKYFSENLLPWYYQTELDNFKLLNNKVVVLYK